MPTEVTYDLLQQVKDTEFGKRFLRVRAPSLDKMAAFIEAQFPDLRTEIEPSWCSTDQKIPGTRLRRPGKGRSGRKLKVFRRADGELIYAHNSAETYRRNAEVASWILDERRKRAKAGGEG